MPERPLVIQTEDLEPESRAWMEERCDYRVVPFGCPEFEVLLPEARGLVIRTYTTVNQDLLDRAPNLKVVGRAGVALENVDIPACTARGVRVVHAPISNQQAVVEYVFALLFDAIRPRTQLDRAVELDEWERIRKELTAPVQLSDLTLGVIGVGRIGSRVANIAKTIGARVLGNDLLSLTPDQAGGAEMVALDTLLAESDIITIHIDTRPSNRHFVSTLLLSSCRRDVLLLNASRGFVLDESALATFLIANPGARAVLDVHDPEPFTPKSPLIGLPSARLMPHIAAATLTAKRNMSWVVRDVWRVLSGDEPEFPAKILG